MRRTESLRHGFSDMSAVAAAAAKTPREEILERDFIEDRKNKREYKVKEVYSQQTEKNIIIPDVIRLHLKGIRNSLKKQDKIQYVGINELLSSTNLDEINYLFIDILRGLDVNSNEYKNLIKIQNALNTKITRRLESNMRKKALRNSRKRKKKQKKGGRRTRGKKRKGGNKRQIQINTNQIKKNSQNLKKLKLRMERCACKEEEDDGYDKLRRSDFLSDIELQQPPKPVKVIKENRAESPTSVMDEPTGAAALALRMGGGYSQKKRRQQKGGERTPGNWIKYNEILTTDRCIIPDEQGRQCNNPLMNPRSPEKTAYMMNCGCVAHTDCINKHCEGDPDLLCPQCGLEIWESCTEVDLYLNAVRTGENDFVELPDILENPDQYWRPARSRRQPRSNVSFHRPNRTQGGRKKKRKTKKKKRKRKTKKKHHKKRKWSLKYKRSINCKRPKGFSQRQYCKYKKI